MVYIYIFFSYFVCKLYLFAITAYFLSLPDKNLWFSYQRRREGVVGDANGSIKMGIVYCSLPFVKSWQDFLLNVSIATSNKNLNL